MRREIRDQRSKIKGEDFGKDEEFLVFKREGAADLFLVAGEKKTALLLGGGSARFRLMGEGAELTLLGVIVGQGSDELSMDVEVIHERPKTKAEVILKSVVLGEAKVNIRGSVKINKGARGSEDLLRENVLLLGEKARGETYPYLEIEENDVVAKHGATVGRLGEEPLFYLMSRGLSEKAAQSLLVRGFLAEVLERIPAAESDRIGMRLMEMLEKSPFSANRRIRRDKGGANGDFSKNL